MCVVKEKPEAESIPQLEHVLRKRGRIPFMQHDYIHSGKPLCPVLEPVFGIIGTEIDITVQFMKASKRFFSARLSEEIINRPPCRWFKHGHVLSLLDESSQKAAQEVCISIVPIGANTVGQVGDAEFRRHLRFPLWDSGPARKQPNIHQPCGGM